MDTQTVIALLIVFLSAIVVVLRVKQTLMGWFKRDSATSPCGNCTGCVGKKADPLIQIQPFVRDSQKRS